jgi:hypothetical protein
MIVTNFFKNRLATALTNPATLLKSIVAVRVGEGGWETVSSSRVPRTEDPALTDLDIILDAGRGAGSKRYDVAEKMGYFTVTSFSASVVYTPDPVARVVATLNYADYNLKSAGVLIYNPALAPDVTPKIFEIGCFDADGNMLLYGTFPEQIKDGTKQIQNRVDIVIP